MKCVVKRKGFCPSEIRQLAESANRAVWAVLCLANESCAIGNEHPVTLRNCLTGNFRKHAQIYAAFVNLRTGEVSAQSYLNCRYGNRLPHEIHDFETKCRILRQLERRLWAYLDEAGLDLWMLGLDEELEDKVIRRRREQRERDWRLQKRLEESRERSRRQRLHRKNQPIKGWIRVDF
jgi:lambda repressor-like predicted transcriptional regulator